MTSSFSIDISELQLGMFIQLPVNWMQHPFATNSFRITTVEQIRALGDLGLASVLYFPNRSTLVADAGSPDASGPGGPTSRRPGTDAQTPLQGDSAPLAGTGNAAFAPQSSVAAHEASLGSCMEQYLQATTTYDRLAASADADPAVAAEQARALVLSSVHALQGKDPCAIRLLADAPGGSAAAHAVNVMVLSLLLGRSLGLNAEQNTLLGLAALLHDIGKSALPLHIAEPGAPLAAAELQRHHGHVGSSVALGQRMGLSSDVLIAMAQHHELADGSGYPLGLLVEDFSQAGRILALVNAYDRLCHPLQGQPALTPHEAVSQLYAQQSNCFHQATLAAFIRMMGVYPPGSLVQLTDGRHALVVSVQPDHPLRPLVRLPAVPGQAHGEQVLDLSMHLQLGIRRSLRPAQLPRSVLEALLPGQRIGYYFERAVQRPGQEGSR